MKRAVKQFEKNEVNVIPYPTDYQTNSIRKLLLWICSVGGSFAKILFFC